MTISNGVSGQFSGAAINIFAPSTLDGLAIAQHTANGGSATIVNSTFDGNGSTGTGPSGWS